MGNSVAGRIALGAMILVVLAVAVTSYMAIVRQTDIMEADEDRAADLLSSAIAISSASDIVKQDIANLIQTVKRIKEQNSTVVWIAIYDVENNKLVQYPESNSQQISLNTRLMTRPIQAHMQKFGEIKMLFNTSPREIMRRDIISTTLAVAAILLFIALLGSLTWAHFFAKPIVALDSAAEQVSKGDLKTKVKVKGKDEIARLSARFNEMVDNLARSREELERTLNELSALYSVARIINTTSDRSEILRLNIETLATGFNFSPIVILLQLQHKWLVAAVKSGGAETHPTFPMEEVNISELGLVKAIDSDSPIDIDPNLLSKEWGLGEGFQNRVLAVPLKSGSSHIGLLIAGVSSSEEKDAAQILSVVASQISPPILVSIMTEREMFKLTNPFVFISNRIDEYLKNAKKFGVELSIITFHFAEKSWKEGATSVEKKFQELENELKSKVNEAELIVRYGVNCLIVVVPGWSKLDARKNMMMIELTNADDLDTSIVASPEDGETASELLAAIEGLQRA
ncbi:MAG: hypothetical protein AUJ18_08640 [Candidatus Hydrogenedentes bacterium CG1_02_42_14]|nr:MAG: hypothetical protein AUJ18_08640 [Candidatus Hydrogenedentes bacterium CG1_02_42_14]